MHILKAKLQRKCDTRVFVCIYLLGFIHKRQGVFKFALLPDEDGVFKRGVGNQIFVCFQFPGKLEHLLEALLSLEWGLHAFEAHAP